MTRMTSTDASEMNGNKTRRPRARRSASPGSTNTSLATATATLLAWATASTGTPSTVTIGGGMTLLLSAAAEAKLADRSRVVRARNLGGGKSNRDVNGRPIEGPAYRVAKRDDLLDAADERDLGVRYGTGGIKSALSGDRYGRQAERQRQALHAEQERERELKQEADHLSLPLPKNRLHSEGANDSKGDARMLNLRGSSSAPSSSSGGERFNVDVMDDTPEQFHRRLSSRLTGCCSNYQSYYAADMCGLYGQDCQDASGGNSHDSGDGDCEMDGLSFIGISFSVNVAEGNPYSYQLCDQFPMNNIIDRDYNYVMSMDEDGWLVGGGYKQFDYSGKMPYIDSSHTELLRVGSLDPNYGGTSIDQVYSAMSSVGFPPISVFPEYLKGGGGHHSNDDGDDEYVSSSDITLVVSVVDEYDDNNNYSGYEQFLDDLFDAMYSVGAGPCMDDHDTDPHVSMSRGTKFKSSWHQQQYMYEANLEVAVWQAMYPNGVVIGTNGYASFPPGRGGTRQYVGYGNLYFFFDRANITKAFAPYRGLSDDEAYYATLTKAEDVSGYYSSTTSINFDYSGSGDGDDAEWEHNPYNWKATMAMHDMTEGWDLPPNCEQEGETFFGIPLATKSDSKLQTSTTFQEQFDFEKIVDRNYTYISSFGTNHGWLVGEYIGNAAGSIVDKDTAHIPIFYTGTMNVDMGGISLSDMIKIAKNIEFGKLYIKPAFVFVDDNGHVKLQFEADPYSALAYLYDALCKELGIAWNYDSPSNNLGIYTNCAMHAAGDRAAYGCGPDGENTGGFCPQMTLGYKVRFQSEDHAAAYLDSANNYVDVWRSQYPSGVAVGSTNFCPDGGCLGLFLNRYDLYNVFKPDLGGSWVEYNGASMPPTFSPAPTWTGGCDNPHNVHLDKCFRKRAKPKLSSIAWDALGVVGQFSILLVLFMSVTLSMSIFLARARKRKRKGETYLGFFIRDLKRKKKKKLRKKKKKKLGSAKGLEDDLLGDDRKSKKSSRSKSKSLARSRSASKSRSSAPRSSRSRSRPRDDKSRSEKSRSTRSQSRSRTDTSRSRRGSSRSRSRSRSQRLPSSSARDEDKRTQLV
mmetsp:Transcript_8642/g.19543  ORF Transcript_8642/g.19543 Transcript_8642/m.19543 type:complete len:1080 (-) Transcript_8642:204-3443(-)